MRACLCFVIAFVLLLALSCDRGSSSATGNSSSSSSSSAETSAARLPVLKPVAAEITPVISLLPRRPTHLAVDPLGNLYLTQELDAAARERSRGMATTSAAGADAAAGAGGDALFVAGEADLPRATPLSSSAILSTMGVRAANAGGNIRSIAAARDGRIYFYFAGGAGKQVALCFGQYNPRSGEIRILADTQQLARDSGMGGSVALARATLVASGPSVWLWLRHPDAAVVFRIDTAALPIDGPANLARPFNRLTSARASDGPPMELARQDDYEISPGGRAGTLLLTDLYGGAIWEMDERGAVTVLHSLVGLPRGLSVPAVILADASVDSAAIGITPGTIVLFAADSDPIEPHVAERTDQVQLSTVYPALLLLRPDDAALSDDSPPRPGGSKAPPLPNVTTRLIAVPRDQLHGQGGLAVYAMQVQQLVYEPKRGTWLGYDAPSGQLVRIRISVK